jgi:hypothetical protein
LLAVTKQVFGFIGIDDINILEADQMNLDAETSFIKALLKIEQKYQAIAAQEQANAHT